MAPSIYIYIYIEKKKRTKKFQEQAEQTEILIKVVNTNRDFVCM